MVNQNINTMKQPELGKKISELRRAKGLTQEQLVDMCNLNVRTIQRIEAGEVTPRNYTIKALFEALEIDWIEEEEAVAQEENAIASTVFDQGIPENQKQNLLILYLALFAGVINLVSPLFINSLHVSPLQEDNVDLASFWWVRIGIAFLSSMFLGGMIKMTYVFPNKILRGTLWVMLIANLLFVAVELAIGVELSFGMFGFYILRAIVFGAFYLLIGVGFLSYKNIWSNYTQIIGVLGILSGVLTMSIIGAFVVTVPLTLFKIGQLGFLFWGINKIGRTSSPDSTFTAELQS